VTRPLLTAPFLSPRSPALADDPIVRSAALVAVVSAVFLAFPGIDLWFTGLFYDPATGFPMSRLAAFTGLRDVNDLLLSVAVLVMVATVAVKLAWPARPIALPPSRIVFLLTTLVLGPGLLVNGIFKSNWGRPRPTMVDAFGGDAPFVEVWRITDHCARNCSFVSGEASSAIWFVALAVLAPPRWRLPVAKALLVLAVFLSLNRVAFGGHFLSDVVLSWGLTVALMAAVYRVTIDAPPAWLTDDSLEGGLARLGQRLRGVASGWSKGERSR